MKKLLVAGVALAVFAMGSPASAADLSPLTSPAPIAGAAPIINWSGFYAGGHVGAGWGDSDWHFTPAFNTFTSHTMGPSFIGGGQVGWNHQSGGWVFGLEADVSWPGGLNGSSTCPDTSFTCRTQVNLLATGTARVGLAVDRSLMYVKGGVAWAQDAFNTFNTLSGVADRTGSASPFGWVVGAGLEQALTDKWSWKIEYNYINLNPTGIALTLVSNTSDVQTFDVRQSIQTVKLGLNYRFN